MPRLFIATVSLSSLVASLFLTACSPSSPSDAPNDGPSASAVSSEAKYAYPSPGASEQKHSTYQCHSPVYRLCSDGQIAAIASAANHSEVAMATMVIENSTSIDVRALAQTLIADHLRLQSAAENVLVSEGIALIENGISNEIEGSTQLMIGALGAKSGVDFDIAFINHILLAQLRTLNVLDRLLLASVSNPKLEAVLGDTRVAVAKHLQLTIAVQASLDGPCGSRNGVETCDDPQQQQQKQR